MLGKTVSLVWIFGMKHKHCSPPVTLSRDWPFKDSTCHSTLLVLKLPNSNTGKHVCSHAHVSAHTHTHTHARTHARTHAHTHTCTCARAQTHTHTHTHMNVHTHMYTVFSVLFACSTCSLNWETVRPKALITSDCLNWVRHSTALLHPLPRILTPNPFQTSPTLLPSVSSHPSTPGGKHLSANHYWPAPLLVTQVSYQVTSHSPPVHRWFNCNWGRG